MTITALPPAPDPTDSATVFNAKAFAFLAALAPFVVQANDQADAINADKLAAAASALAAAASALAASNSQAAASASADSAAASAGASAWVSGAAYTAGQRTWSPINQQLYRRISTGSGAIDPMLDAANWARVWPEPDLVTCDSFFF